MTRTVGVQSKRSSRSTPICPYRSHCCCPLLLQRQMLVRLHLDVGANPPPLPVLVVPHHRRHLLLLLPPPRPRPRLLGCLLRSRATITVSSFDRQFSRTGRTNAGRRGSVSCRLPATTRCSPCGTRAGTPRPTRAPLDLPPGTVSNKRYTCLRRNDAAAAAAAAVPAAAATVRPIPPSDTLLLLYTSAAGDARGGGGRRSGPTIRCRNACRRRLWRIRLYRLDKMLLRTLPRRFRFYSRRRYPLQYLQRRLALSRLAKEQSPLPRASCCNGRA